MKCYCLHKLFANATALCLFAILAVGMVLSPLSAQTDSSRLPMKSLTMGNRWVYAVNSTEQTFAPPNNVRLFETVVRDTIIQGKKYGVIYSSFDNSIRYERSTDSAIYIFSNAEIVQHYWNVDSMQVFMWNQWLGFATSTYANYQIPPFAYSLNHVLHSSGSLTFTNTLRSLPSIRNKNFTVEYTRTLGVTQISETLEHSSFRYNYQKNLALVGAVIDGQAIGDTFVPSPKLFIKDSVLHFVQKQDFMNVAIPVVWDGMRNDLNISPQGLRPSVHIRYDSTVFQAVRFVEPYTNFSLGSPDSLLSRYLISPYKTIAKGSIIQSTLLVDSRNKNSHDKCLWILCHIKKPLNETTAMIEIQVDSTNSSYTPWINYYNFPITTRNGAIIITPNIISGVLSLPQSFVHGKGTNLSVHQIAPNPASDIISVTLSASEKTPVTLSLLNTLGQRIRQAEVTLQTDSQEIPFSLRDVPHGVYMVVIQSQSETLTRQIHILP